MPQTFKLLSGAVALISVMFYSDLRANYNHASFPKDVSENPVHARINGQVSDQGNILVNSSSGKQYGPSIFLAQNTQNGQPAPRTNNLDIRNDSSVRWQDKPEVSTILSEVSSFYPATQHRGCVRAHGPISSDFLKRLFKNVSFSVRDNRNNVKIMPISQEMLGSSRFCLADNAHCAVDSYSLFYCSSGEVLFLNTSNSSSSLLVTQVIERKKNPILPETISEIIYGRENPDIPSNRPRCVISNGWGDATSIKWTGSCQEGRASGSGTIEWMSGDRLLWRTKVGPGTGLQITNGVLSREISVSSFNFVLDSCDQGISGYRAVKIHAPNGTPTSYFSNSWVANSLLEMGARYAQSECPVERKGLSNIQVTLEIDNQVIVRVRTNNKDRFAWGEYSNIAESSVMSEIRESEQRRLANQRRQAANARSAALDEQYRRRRDNLKMRANGFISSGSGSVSDLAAAIELDHVRAISRLERGVTLRVSPVSSVQTVTHRNSRHYAVTNSVSSPFGALEREFRANRDFSWENWSALTQSDFRGTTRLVCLYSQVNSVPSAPRDVRANFVSISKGSSDTIITMTCR